MLSFFFPLTAAVIALAVALVFLLALYAREVRVRRAVERFVKLWLKKWR